MIKRYRPTADSSASRGVYAAQWSDVMTDLAENLAWAAEVVRWKGRRGKGRFQVKAREGWVDIPFGQYLVMDGRDNFFPCEPDVFERNWEEA